MDAWVVFAAAPFCDVLYNRQKQKKNKDAVLKVLAQEWRELSDRDRAYWDEEARNDKVRYVVYMEEDITLRLQCWKVSS